MLLAAIAAGAGASVGPLGGIDGFLLSADKRGELLQHGFKPVVFLKTHKTGSSTIATMLLRMADWRNLTVMLPCSKVSTGLNYPRAFPGAAYPTPRAATFDVIASHAVLDARLMRAYVRSPMKPLVFTIVREPMSRLTSALNWLNRFHGTAQTEDLVKRLERAERLPLAQVDEVLFINNQAHDLGWYSFESNARSTRNDQDLPRVQRWLRALDGQLDLVLILEQLPEGLATLRQALGVHRVALEELVAVRKKINPRENPVRFSLAQQRRLLHLNRVDVSAYEHFYAQFVDRWAHVPREVRSDAVTLRRMQEQLKDGSNGCRLRGEGGDDVAATSTRAPGPSAGGCPPALLTDVKPYLWHLRRRAQSSCDAREPLCGTAYSEYLLACPWS